MLRIFKSIIFISLLANLAFSQNEFENSIEFGFSLGLAAPFADLAKRSGNLYGGDASFNYFQDKNKYSLQLGFFSSDNVREDPLSGFRTSGGYILSENGVITPISTRLVGTFVGVQYTRILSKKNQKRLKFYGGIGAGVLHHRINFLELSNSVPYVKDNYELGLNRNSFGPYLSQSIGIRIPTSKMKIELELYFKEAFTNQKRPLDISNQELFNDRRFDALLGLTTRWYIRYRSVQKGQDKFY